VLNSTKTALCALTRFVVLVVMLQVVDIDDSSASMTFLRGTVVTAMLELVLVNTTSTGAAQEVSLSLLGDSVSLSLWSAPAVCYQRWYRWPPVPRISRVQAR
jgi:hypothetical protein